MPEWKPIPTADDEVFDPAIPPKMVVDLAARYDSAESVVRLRLLGEVFNAWHQEQDRKMRAAGAAFLARADESLKSAFGGELPIGREFASLQPKAQQMLVTTLTAPLATYGFADEAAAKRWLAKATVVSIQPRYTVIVPVYNASQRMSYSYPILLP